MTDRANYWNRMMTAWERSGLTQAEFCRRRGLKAVTFSWWKRQLARSDAGGGRGRDGRRRLRPQPREASSFVEVALPGEMALAASRSDAAGTMSNAVYEVALPDGTSIRLPADFDVQRVSQLLAAVARSC